MYRLLQPGWIINLANATGIVARQRQLFMTFKSKLPVRLASFTKQLISTSEYLQTIQTMLLSEMKYQ